MKTTSELDPYRQPAPVARPKPLAPKGYRIVISPYPWHPGWLYSKRVFPAYWMAWVFARLYVWWYPYSEVLFVPGPRQGEKLPKEYRKGLVWWNKEARAALTQTGTKRDSWDTDWERAKKEPTTRCPCDLTGIRCRNRRTCLSKFKSGLPN